MKKLNFDKKIVTSFLAFLILTGCYHFDFVNQPYTTDPDSFFDVEISVTASNNSGLSYFGVLMPIGWTTADSIEYINDTTNITGFMTYSDSLTQLMSSIDPPPLNYYWWVGVDLISVNSSTTFTSEFKIYTDSQTGNFFLDYMLGDDYNGLNYNRSDDHLIIVGDPVGCFPEGITFTSQTEIDNFQTNYPSCTAIAGNVTITGNNITNLNGLNNLTSIGGRLWIVENDSLTSLGLDNLSSIGGTLLISNNDSLISLSNLDNATSIGGDLSIYQNYSLTSLTGLNNVTSIGRDVAIEANYSLHNLTGLENVTSIVGHLNISSTVLTSLSGLNNLISIGGDLSIISNHSLTNLTGLEGLTSIGGSLDISSYNRDGGSSNLKSLSGLDNLSSIGGDLSFFANNGLTSLTGLENLTAIEGNLSIGKHDMFHYGNNALENLTGLDNVTSIGGDISIRANNSLTSLTGLDNIDAASIDSLFIYNNTYLSECEVQSICNYLASPNGVIEIYDNATGCNNQEEVEEACLVSVDEVQLSEKLLIYPNPSSTQITIELPNTPQKYALLTIYNISSQQLLTSKITEQKTIVDISGLPDGIYFIKVTDDRTMMVGKLVKK